MDNKDNVNVSMCMCVCVCVCMLREEGMTYLLKELCFSLQGSYLCFVRSSEMYECFCFLAAGPTSGGDSLYAQVLDLL